MTSSGEVSPASVTPAGTPSLLSQAPKYGTLIPNRIFVGGIAANTTEIELKQYFMAYGAVKDCKIIADRAGVSKGYGFVTFETQEDAEKIIKKEGDNLIFKDRKLNIGPAIRKQAITRMYEQSVSPGTILFTNGVPYTYQNGMAVFHPQEGYPVPTTPQPAYPVMVPHGQPMYVSQPNFAYQSPTAAATATQWAAAASPWRWTAPPSPATPTMAASQYMYPMQTLPPEMIYAQLPPQAAFQPGDLGDGSVIETAQAEGSMVMDPSMVGVLPRYVEGIAPSVATMYAHAMNAASAVEYQYQTMMPSTPPIPVTPKTGPVAYKRPMAPTPRKVLNTQSSVTYSPRATPPMKMAAMQGPGQCIITKTSNGTPISVISQNKCDTSEMLEGTLLTPPPTPHAKLTCQ